MQEALSPEPLKIPHPDQPNPVSGYLVVVQQVRHVKLQLSNKPLQATYYYVARILPENLTRIHQSTSNKHRRLEARYRWHLFD